MFKNKGKTTATKSMPSKPASAPVSSAKPIEKVAEKKAATEDLENVINKGTVIEGNVMTDGDILLSGKVIGDVSTKAKITVDEAAHIEGNISAENADIAGSVKGTVTVSGLLTIRESSKIDGDVNTKNLNVESGALFTGRLNVGEPKPIVSSKMSGGKQTPDTSTAVDSVLD